MMEIYCAQKLPKIAAAMRRPDAQSEKAVDQEMVRVLSRRSLHGGLAKVATPRHSRLLRPI